MEKRAVLSTGLSVLADDVCRVFADAAAILILLGRLHVHGLLYPETFEETWDEYPIAEPWWWRLGKYLTSRRRAAISLNNIARG